MAGEKGMAPLSKRTSVDQFRWYGGGVKAGLFSGVKKFGGFLSKVKTCVTGPSMEELKTAVRRANLTLTCLDLGSIDKDYKALKDLRGPVRVQTIEGFQKSVLAILGPNYKPVLIEDFKSFTEGHMTPYMPFSKTFAFAWLIAAAKSTFTYWGHVVRGNKISSLNGFFKEQNFLWPKHTGENPTGKRPLEPTAKLTAKDQKEGYFQSQKYLWPTHSSVEGQAKGPDGVTLPDQQKRWASGKLTDKPLEPKAKDTAKDQKVWFRQPH